MELLPGMNLRELVKLSGPLPPQRAVHFLVQVCESLSEAHDYGLIHRDIKPANIFASTRGGIDDFTKLLDFGVVAETKLAGNELHNARHIVGTPEYMSPEQVLSLDRIDPRSDLYAVGAVAYFLLTGRPPFVHPSALETVMSQVRRAPEPVSTFRPDVPADLEAVVMRCLKKSPDDRPASANELKAELQACDLAGDWSEHDAAAWWQTLRAEV